MPRCWFKAGDDVSHSNLAQFLYRTVSLVPFPRYAMREHRGGGGRERERERENRSRRRVDRYCARSRIKFRGFIRTLAMGRIDRIILDQTRIWMGRSGGIWDCLLRLEPTKGTVLSLLNSCLDSSDDSPSPTSLYLL